MSIVHLTPDHAGEAARLHIAGQPGTFLTSLGLEVLTLIYHALPATSTGFGFVAVADSQNRSLDAALPRSQSANSPVVQGFVSATTSVGRLFLQVGLRHFHRLPPLFMRRFLQRPVLVVYSLQTVLYPLLVQRDGDQADRPGAELLSIMVEPALRSQGIGAALLQALCAECVARGVERLNVTVDAANAGARRFYERHGFRLAHTFTLYGRSMCSYTLALRLGAS